MDAPNAPNPTNPNAHDQIVDAVQGPTNQAQCPMVQNQAQVLAGQIPAQIPAVQVPVQGPAQVGQNLPVQPPPQQVLIQPVPSGMVVPAPQIIYQNWIGRNLNSQVSQKRMQNPISLVVETGWKHITSQKEKKLDVFT